MGLQVCGSTYHSSLMSRSDVFCGSSWRWQQLPNACAFDRSETPRQARRSTQCHISLRYKIGPLSLPPIFDWPSRMATCVFHHVASTTYIGLYLRKCHIKQSKVNNVINWKVITYQPKCVPSPRLQKLWRLVLLYKTQIYEQYWGRYLPFKWLLAFGKGHCVIGFLKEALGKKFL